MIEASVSTSSIRSFTKSVSLYETIARFPAATIANKVVVAVVVAKPQN